MSLYKTFLTELRTTIDVLKIWRPSSISSPCFNDRKFKHKCFSIGSRYYRFKSLTEVIKKLHWKHQRLLGKVVQLLQQRNYYTSSIM